MTSMSTARFMAPPPTERLPAGTVPTGLSRVKPRPPAAGIIVAMRGRAKTLLILVGALLACVAVALVTLRIVGLDPKDRRPGLWLTGDLVTTPVTDWSFTDKYPTIFVQTRSWYGLPHSVTTSSPGHDGQPYLPPGVV